MEFPFRTSTPSQSEIFSLKIVIARMYVLACQDSTPSQSEIFSQAVIVACSLCSYVCIGLPGPAHPPKVKYSLKLLLWLALSARMYVLASVHPPKVKYSLSQAVIVACSYGVSFQDLHPPKVKYSLKAIFVACSLCSYVCIGLPRPAHPPKVKYSLSQLFAFFGQSLCNASTVPWSVCLFK